MNSTYPAKDYPIHVVTLWMGNTSKIALKHYLMTTDADFARIAKCAEEIDGKGPQGAVSLEEPDAESAGITELCGSLLDDVPVSSGGQGIRTSMELLGEFENSSFSAAQPGETIDDNLLLTDTIAELAITWRVLPSHIRRSIFRWLRLQRENLK